MLTKITEYFYIDIESIAAIDQAIAINGEDNIYILFKNQECIYISINKYAELKSVIDKKHGNLQEPARETDLKECDIDFDKYQHAQCVFNRGWAGICNKSGYPFCNEHINYKCKSCGNQAIRECTNAVSLVCGAPLCNECECPSCNHV